MSSIKDVAELAGVSIGSVSNVLNRPDLVRPETRERVEKAIAELDYVPNGSARQLKAGRSPIVAYVAFDTSNPFFSDVAKGAEDELRGSDLSMFLCNSGHSAVREDEHLANLAELRVRGVLITAVDLDNPRLAQLRNAGISVVIVDSVLDRDTSDCCAVGVDDVAGGYMAVEHLIEQGHTRIGFVGGPDELPQVRQRYLGAQNAMRAAGLDHEALVVFPTDSLDVDEGRRAGERLLGLPTIRRPTATFCANDLLAVGMLQCVIQQGLRCPQDLAIIGYDDIDFASASAVPLSSVAQPRQQLGQAAAQLLLAESEEGTTHQHDQVTFSPHLVARASTALLPD